MRSLLGLKSLLLGLAVLTALLSWSRTGLALSGEEAAALRQKGLSEKTLTELALLHQDSDRLRQVVVTAGEVEELLAAGFGEELIRLFIRLDEVTGDEETIPVSPAQARQLRESGVSLHTLRLMLISEISRAARPPGFPAPAGQTRLGREEVTLPDGRKVIRYYSGDPTRPELSVQEQEEEELRRAWELLEKMNLTIEIER